MKKITAPLLFSLTLGMLSATVAKADNIPYQNAGSIAPQVATYASGTGGITVYFRGSNAAFTDYVRVYDVQTHYNSGNILGNHSSTQGDAMDVGTEPGQINEGDQLIFYIDSPQGLFASDASYSADNINHAYITDFSGTDGTGIPAGLFVGLEDEKNGSSDLDYNDDTFVFTGVKAPTLAPTPEPGSLSLLGTGTLSILGLARRRFLTA